jgi:hypothetical protein
MFLRHKVLDKLASVIIDHSLSILRRQASTPRATSDKFSGAHMLGDAESMADWYLGLEGIAGSPQPRLSEGMRREHCKADDSAITFTSPQYGTQTQSRIEFWFVTSPEEGLAELELSSYPAEEDPSILDGSHARRPASIDAFAEQLRESNERLQALSSATLSDNEFFGARLFTGPMYYKCTSPTSPARAL